MHNSWRRSLPPRKLFNFLMEVSLILAPVESAENSPELGMVPRDIPIV